MNDIRLRGLGVTGSDAAGRKNPDNHAQTARNLRRSLRNAATGARLIQAEGWTANRLALSQPHLPMRSKSFTGSSAASIDVSDATRDAPKGLPASFTFDHVALWEVAAVIQEMMGRSLTRPCCISSSVGRGRMPSQHVSEGRVRLPGLVDGQGRPVVV